MPGSFSWSATARTCGRPPMACPTPEWRRRTSSRPRPTTTSSSSGRRGLAWPPSSRTSGLR
eukprot:4823457-Alexandrium_andersonii.AAC.1